MKELCIFEKSVKNEWMVDIFPMGYFHMWASQDIEFIKIIKTYDWIALCYYIIKSQDLITFIDIILLNCMFK